MISRLTRLSKGTNLQKKIGRRFINSYKLGGYLVYEQQKLEDTKNMDVLVKEGTE